MKLPLNRLAGERRSAPRYRVNVPVRYRLRRSSAAEQTAESENLSELGIFFATDLEFKVGATLDLRMRVTTELNGMDSAEWLCTGHVVRVEPSDSLSGMSRIGVQFDCFELLRPKQFQLAQACE